MYKRASQLALKFSSSVGTLNVERLWELKLTQLSTMIKEVKKELKGEEEKDEELSFLNAGNVQTESVNQLRFNILKDVFLTKKAEVEAIVNKQKNAEHNKTIMELIAAKQGEELKSKTIAELEAMIIK
jgi:hypothetical protein